MSRCWMAAAMLRGLMRRKPSHFNVLVTICFDGCGDGTTACFDGHDAVAIVPWLLRCCDETLWLERCALIVIGCYHDNMSASMML